MLQMQRAIILRIQESGPTAAMEGDMADLPTRIVDMVDMEVRTVDWDLIRDMGVVTTVMEEDTAWDPTPTVFVTPSKQDHNVCPHE